MDVSVGGCLKHSMVFIRQRKRERWLDQGQVGVKLDLRQTIVENCALDGDGYWADGGRLSLTVVILVSLIVARRVPFSRPQCFLMVALVIDAWR